MASLFNFLYFENSVSYILNAVLRILVLFFLKFITNDYIISDYFWFEEKRGPNLKIFFLKIFIASIFLLSETDLLTSTLNIHKIWRDFLLETLLAQSRLIVIRDKICDILHFKLKNFCAR